ncbi:MAG: glycosyltransferase family 39 protein [Patescibacteria group bacterium]
MLTWLFTKTPLLFLTQPFWRDEAFSYFMAKKNIIEMIFLTVKDFNPPLYYFILHYWMKIFGGSEIALRSLSIVFFWATIYVAFLFLNKIFKMKERKAFFYLILFIINPLLLYYAFEARMYSMLAFFASLSCYAFYKKNNRLYLFSTIAGLFTHYFMLLVVFSQIFILIINRKNIKFIKNKFVYLSLLVFSPWLVFFFSQNKLQSSFWIEKPHLKDIFVLLGIIYTGNESAFYPGELVVKIQNNVMYSSLVLLFITAIGIYLYIKKLSKKDRPHFQMLFIWGVGISLIVGLVSFIKPLYFPRYLIFTTVGLLLLIIFILEKINIYLRAVLFAILIVLTFSYQKLQIEYRKKTDLRKVLREIQVIANKKDFIYTDDLDFFTAQYYLKNNNVYIYGKSYQDIPAYNGKVLIPKENVATNLPFYPQKAFILKSNGKYSIQAMY